jgi:alkaline phosphatase D
LGAPLQVEWELVRDREFRSVVNRGRVTTDPESDHTVKIDVRGLHRRQEPNASSRI